MPSSACLSAPRSQSRSVQVMCGYQLYELAAQVAACLSMNFVVHILQDNLVVSGSSQPRQPFFPLAYKRSGDRPHCRDVSQPFSLCRCSRGPHGIDTCERVRRKDNGIRVREHQPQLRESTSPERWERPLFQGFVLIRTRGEPRHLGQPCCKPQPYWPGPYFIVEPQVSRV